MRVVAVSLGSLLGILDPIHILRRTLLRCGMPEERLEGSQAPLSRCGHFGQGFNMMHAYYAVIDSVKSTCLCTRKRFATANTEALRSVWQSLGSAGEALRCTEKVLNADFESELHLINMFVRP